ncbi:uncharacterized protein PFL1_01270 [Pseudozyma flocculosa PF-1]|uniref:RNA helicase n=1 Tax=Pseudozyma flocculosa TaxID=84751 RepID=A0A5C3EWG5_9BASI|nr:uncharacterized protein PFL1_01270 [Pseudozyma flocculosa PF-1]EPQ31081.1 hypothetical protein PFL1_01270 [Pseudozyma flocculosa PF-1]SPO35936.1 related to U5 snRNP 100 kD protein [Pseudozyma flocculosa]
MSKQPLSIEEILQRQKQESAFKPKFLTKAQRQQQAQLAQQQQQEEQKRKQEEEKRRRIEFEEKARSAAASSSSSTYNDHHRHASGPSSSSSSSLRDRDRGRDRDGGYPRDTDYSRDAGVSLNYDDDRSHAPQRGPRGDRGRPAGDPRGGGGRPYGDRPHQNGSGGVHSGNGNGNGNISSSAAPAGTSASGPSEKPITDAEQDLIRQRYLGLKEIKRKPKKKATDKRFNFDWRDDDDTSDKINPVYSTSMEPSLFGAGGRGGTDPLHRNGRLDHGASDGGTSGPGGSGGGSLVKRGVRSAFDEKHWSEKALDEMKERDWRIFREDFGIAARGGNIPKPIRSWKESSIPRPIMEAIQEIGYTDPSPIQRQAIPIGLQNRDLIGIAETGSGKTASFVIPMLAYISELPPLTEATRHLGPYALILAPTRELAQQIEGETRKFASKLGYKCVSIVGGRDMNEQAISVQEGAEIVIATPGRLKDCVERHVLVLSQCTYVVMDEADRMVNLGFEEVVNYILDSLPVSNLKPDTDDAEDPLKLLRREGESRMDKYRVTMLYSATMPATVERMARKYLRRPATITIGDANQAVGTVEQVVEFIHSEEKKKARLLQILNTGGFAPPMIVFVNQKKAADALGKDLQRAGWYPAVLHSGKTQAMREEALASLRSGECPVLVATDLAGRGIDVPDVSLVVNFQMANHIEAYVHRIGRTGRAGKRGVAITFLDSGDDEVMYDLKQEIAKSPISKLPQELARHPAAQTKMTREMKRKRDREDEG